MARRQKAMPAVKLERYPHRDALERLRQAYQLLIEAQQSIQDTAEIKIDKEHRPQEVKV